MSILVNKKSGFQTQKQWPPKCHIRFRKTGSPPPYWGNIPKKYQIFLVLPLSSSVKFCTEAAAYQTRSPRQSCTGSATLLSRARRSQLSKMQICSPKAFQNKTCLTAPVFSSLFNNPQDIVDAWIMSIFWFHWWLKWVKTVCRCCFFCAKCKHF